MFRISFLFATLAGLALLLGPMGAPGGAEAAAHGPGPEWLIRSGTSTDSLAGRVIDTHGDPVMGVDLTLQAGGRTIAATTSRANGSFFFRLREPAPRPWLLRAGRLGYEVAEREVPADASWIQVVLREAPLPLPAIRVEGVRETCAGADDPVARELWSRATALHAGGLDTLGVASYTLARTDTLEGEAPPGPERGLEGAEPGQRGSAPLLRLSWTRRIEREGYAFRVRRTDREKSYDSWSYPPLEADFASHFGNGRFGELNNLVMHREDGDGWVLLFCSQDRDRPYLEGRLELSPDTLIIRVEWSIQTPEPLEHAGGWTRFPPPGPNERPHLLPSESLTWKTLPDSTVLRRAQWYEGWTLAPGDSVPFLPSREVADVGSRN